MAICFCKNTFCKTPLFFELDQIIKGILYWKTEKQK